MASFDSTERARAAAMALHDARRARERAVREDELREFALRLSLENDPGVPVSGIERMSEVA